MQENLLMLSNYMYNWFVNAKFPLQGLEIWYALSFELNRISSLCFRRATLHMGTDCDWQGNSSASWVLLLSYCWRWFNETGFISLHCAHAARHCFILLCLRTDSWYHKSRGKALFWPDCPGRPLSCYPVSRNNYKGWNIPVRSETSGLNLFVFLLSSQYQLCLLGGAAVCVQGLRGARRDRCDGALLGLGLVQRHVLCPGVRNARPLRHHDPEGAGLRTQLSLRWCCRLHVHSCSSPIFRQLF